MSSIPSLFFDRKKYISVNIFRNILVLFSTGSLYSAILPALLCSVATSLHPMSSRSLHISHHAILPSAVAFPSTVPLACLYFCYFANFPAVVISTWPAYRIRVHAKFLLGYFAVQIVRSSSIDNPPIKTFIIYRYVHFMTIPAPSSVYQRNLH